MWKALFKGLVIGLIVIAVILYLSMHFK